MNERIQVTIGILAIQGDFYKHAEKIQALGQRAILVKTEQELNRCAGLILPGGESTTLTRLLHKHALWTPLQRFGRTKSIYGTCAGLILAARETEQNDVQTLDLIDISVRRNAYGRQIDSFIDTIRLDLDGSEKSLEGVFIRAPKITALGADVRAIGWHGDDIIMAENRHVLVSTFHPELTGDTSIHHYFIEKTRNLIGMHRPVQEHSPVG